MSALTYLYWPFDVSLPSVGVLHDSQQVAFLEAAHAKGFASFRFGINDYGARFGAREGCILERGRMRWEVRLADGEQRSLLAYVRDFQAAGKAVENWLGGAKANEVVGELTEFLVTPPGARSSYSMNELE